MTSTNGGSSSGSYEFDAFLDLSGGSPSPVTRPEGNGKAPAQSASSSSMPAVAPHLALPQSFSGPSHQYDLHPQQTGLLPYSMNFDGSFSGGSSPSHTPGGNMSLSPEFKFENDTMMSFFFPEQASGEFVQPNNISFNSDEDLDIDIIAGVKERSISNASSVSMVSQASSSRQQPQQAPRKSAGTPTDPATELKIRQILEDVKRRALSSNDDSESSNQNLPQLQRMKKDEEDMDEDERLLASEEGKKLSSKERRQLRNKVSARAFRSRRKEYISQLETEVNNKSSENTELREKLRSAEVENQSLRDLTRMLLASPQFSSFLDQMHPLTANNSSSSSNSTASSSNLTVPTENISVHRASVPEIQVPEQQLNEFPVPSYIPPHQNYSSYNPRKDANPNQLAGVEDWPLAYVSNGQWGNSPAVFAAEVIPNDIDVNELTKPEDDWMCPADGFRPGFSSGILSQKEEPTPDYSNHTDSNGQYIFDVYEDELEDVPDYLFDYFHIHAPVSEVKNKEEAHIDPETVLPALGLENLFTQLEDHFAQEAPPQDAAELKAEESLPENCRDPQLSRTLEVLERSYRRVGVFCGAS